MTLEARIAEVERKLDLYERRLLKTEADVSFLQHWVLPDEPEPDWDETQQAFNFDDTNAMIGRAHAEETRALFESLAEVPY